MVRQARWDKAMFGMSVLGLAGSGRHGKGRNGIARLVEVRLGQAGKVCLGEAL